MSDARREEELAASGTSGRQAAHGDAEPSGRALASTGTSAETGSAAPSSASAAQAAAEVSRDALEFHFVTGALYHRSRATFFIGLHRTAMFLNILAGTAAAAVVKDYPPVALGLALLLAVISSASLAFDFAGLARKHEDARRTCHDLAAELEEGPADETTLRKLKARMIRAAATEPTVFEAAEKVAFNAAIRSLGRDPKDEWIIPLWCRLLRHMWPFSGVRFAQRKDEPDTAA
jgi:hypothetical protein